MSEPSDPMVKLREACIEALPPWTLQRFAENPRLWRLNLEDVLEVYSAEASPQVESSWLALRAARQLHRDISLFATTASENAERLARKHPAMVIRRCISLCIRQLPFSKSVRGFGGTEYQIQFSMSPGNTGGWILEVPFQGLCALRKVLLEIEGDPNIQELEFTTGLIEQTRRQQEDAVLGFAAVGFASTVQMSPLPFTAKLTILEYPLHLAVQTYIGLNFNTMAMLCKYDFGPMDLACIMDVWLQSNELRRLPEADLPNVVTRTLRFVKLEWAPMVRLSFVVWMHSCSMQASHVWWHSSLIRSCVALEVWRGASDGEPSASRFRSHIVQIVQRALAPHPKVFLAAVQAYVGNLPHIELSQLEAFFPPPASVSDPLAIVARHYLELLRSGAVTVALLMDLLDGFQRIVGPPLEARNHKQRC